MNACKTEQEYLNQIIGPVRRCCKRYGYLPSVLIAQSCLENGYGIPSYWDNPQIRALIGVNNMVGIKRGLLNSSWVDIGLSVWQGGYISKDTPEQYGEEMVTVNADFRIYDTIERSFADYLCFMTYGSNFGAGGEPKYGQKVLAIKDPETLIKKVSGLGYASGQTYPTSVMRIINKHNLTQYDDLTGVEPTTYVPGAAENITINPNPSFEPTHNTSARTGSIDWIVLHYVGALGDAKANIDYYNQLTTTEASADFYCGHAGDIWQYNIYPEKRYCWAIGGGVSGTYFGKAKNANSIHVEMCVKNTTGKAQAANSSTWYFEQATIESAVKLVRYLMKTYGIDVGHVIRHYDVNRKACPGVVGWNPDTGSEAAWTAFRARLVDTSAVTVSEAAQTASGATQTASGDKYVVRRSFDDASSQTNSFNTLAYAKAEANRYPGYSVYEASTGKQVHASTNNDKYVVRKTFSDLKSQTNTFSKLKNAKAEADKYGYTVFEASTGEAVYTPTADKYAVQRSTDAEDVKYRLGLFHILENAKALADQNWGYKVYDITTGKCVYEPKLTSLKKFIAKLVQMDQIMRDDAKDGKPFRYRNKNASKNSKTFEAARADDNRYVNCVTGVQWALIAAMVVGSDRKAIQWYGGAGKIVWCNSSAEADAKKYFDIIEVKNKTAKQCVKDGTIQPGDIVTYMKISHTSAYVANGLWFDAGHAFCDGSGEGAVFTAWIGATPYENYKVAYILRLK